MGQKQAGRALPLRSRDLAAEPHYPPSAENEPAEVLPGAVVTQDKVKLAAARLYGQGYERRHIARILKDHLITNLMRTRPEEQQIAAARNVLKRWEQQEKFRDTVYQQSLIKLDLEAGMVMKGLAKKAKKGRVDAARLIFELTGRHSPKGEAQPTQIAVVINGIPRPGNVQAVAAESVELNEDGELIQVDDAEEVEE